MTPAAQSWLRERRSDPLSVSDWTLPEFSSALSIKVRTGVLTTGERRLAARTFEQLVDETFVVETVLRADFHRAARLVERHDTNLRAADALHLAVAERKGATLHTLDEGQAGAGRVHGIDAVVPVPKE